MRNRDPADSLDIKPFYHIIPTLFVACPNGTCLDYTPAKGQFGALHKEQVIIQTLSGEISMDVQQRKISLRGKAALSGHYLGQISCEGLLLMFKASAGSALQHYRHFYRLELYEITLSFILDRHFLKENNLFYLALSQFQ